MSGGYARSIDANQTEIIHALEQIGATVRTLQLEAQGLPDIIVGHAGVNYLLEIKTEDGELTPAQVEFFIAWKGQKAIIRTAVEALAVLGIVATELGPSTVQGVQPISPFVANAAQIRTVWSRDAWQGKSGKHRRSR